MELNPRVHDLRGGLFDLDTFRKVQHCDAQEVVCADSQSWTADKKEHEA